MDGGGTLRLPIFDFRSVFVSRSHSRQPIASGCFQKGWFFCWRNFSRRGRQPALRWNPVRIYDLRFTIYDLHGGKVTTVQRQRNETKTISYTDVAALRVGTG